MLKKLKAENELLHCDETTMQCNKETGRKATTNSYMWVLASGELEKQKGIIFNYEPSSRRYFYESIPLDDNNKMDTTCDGYKGVQYQLYLKK